MTGTSAEWIILTLTASVSKIFYRLGTDYHLFWSAKASAIVRHWRQTSVDIRII